MTHEALIASLKAKGKKKVDALWHDAEGEIERFRAAVEKQLDEERAKTEHQASLENRELCDSVMKAGEREARKRLATAKSRLGERLYRSAVESLPRFRGKNYEKLFTTLVAKLPEGPWEEVHVNPRDQALAGHLFPGSRVVTDDAIVGGMTVVGREGRFSVINTLEKRLERGGADILPECFKGIQVEGMTDESAA